jgi:restriction endonuclease S subunit
MLESEIAKGQVRNLQIPNNAVAYVDKPSIRAIRIPLPPPNVQERIAEIMQVAYERRRQKRLEAEEFLSDVDSIVFGKLNLGPEHVKEKKQFLKPITTIQGKRFDVEFNMGFHKFDPYREKVSPLGDVISFSKETKNPSKEPNAIFHYIDISSINIVTGEIGDTSEILGQEAPSRARQIVHAGDILISTVRPTRGAIAIVPAEMEGFICSTGFAVVRPIKEVLTEYLHTAATKKLRSCGMRPKRWCRKLKRKSRG